MVLLVRASQLGSLSKLGGIGLIRQLGQAPVRGGQAYQGRDGLGLTRDGAKRDGQGQNDQEFKGTEQHGQVSQDQNESGLHLSNKIDLFGYLTCWGIKKERKQPVIDETVQNLLITNREPTCCRLSDETRVAYER